MNIQITSRKFRAKDNLKDFIKDEIKSLSKYTDDIIDVNVVLSFTHNKDSIKTAEVVLQIPGKTISVQDSSEEFEKSIVTAVNKIATQLKKFKTKRISKKKEPKKIKIQTEND
ncbi:MAG: ribosomal subunit interface protein [Flavobacterium sp.]|nr:ribosomal subunit interface protein [Flavobacterium sp.]